MTDLLAQALRLLGVVQSTPGTYLVRGDAFDVLSKLPTGCIDLCIADPPYGLSNDGTTCSGGKRVSVNKGAWDRSAGHRDDFEFHRRWLRSMQRVLKPEGTLWVSGTQHCMYGVGFAMQLSGWRILNHVTWIKAAPPPNLGTRCLTHSTEGIIWASPNHDEPQRHVFNYDVGKTFNEGKQLKDVWTFAAPGATEKATGKHPAQKPVALMRRIVELASLPGAVVFDPFMGVASTGIAAIELGRVFVGVESDAAHFETACRRLSILTTGHPRESLEG